MASTERTYDRARFRATHSTQRLGSELRTARLAAGRSQRDIAAAARISQTLLARIERGGHGPGDPADHLLAATALVHGLTLMTLYGRLTAAAWLPTR